MQLHEILAQLSRVFKAKYILEMLWYGGHGNCLTALAPNSDAPSFLVAPNMFGWWIAQHNHRNFGSIDVRATRCLASGHDPREDSSGY